MTASGAAAETGSSEPAAAHGSGAESAQRRCSCAAQACAEAPRRRLQAGEPWYVIAILCISVLFMFVSCRFFPFIASTGAF